MLATRAADQNWADSVAGDMERHYSPGRTWEALARAALPLLEPGEVLDIASGDGVLAELLAPHARRYVCIDTSTQVVLAASERLRKLETRRSARRRHARPALRRRRSSTWWC